MHIRKLLILIFIMSFVGCSWFGSKSSSIAKRSSFVDSGAIVDTAKLKRGGALLAIPFQAGPNIEATEELDKIALLMIRGVYETLEEGKAPLELMTSEDSKEAQFILKGYIVKKTEPGRLKKWSLGKKIKTLGVKGKIVHKDSGKVVVHFSRSKETSQKDINHKVLARQIGQDIGRFILSGIN